MDAELIPVELLLVELEAPVFALGAVEQLAHIFGCIPSFFKIHHLVKVKIIITDDVDRGIKTHGNTECIVYRVFPEEYE